MHNPTGFVLLTDQEYIQSLLNTFKTYEDVTMQKLQEYFGHRITKTGENTIGRVDPPVYFTTDEFILKKGTLESVKSDIQTSIGLYIFNLYVLNSVFKDRLNYYNPEDGLTKKNVEKLLQIVVDLLIDNKITGEEFGTFQTRFEWLGYRGTIWTPGQSFEFAKVNPDVAKAKPELLRKWKEEVAAGKDPVSTYVIMVEQPLLKIAENSLKNNESWPIYARGGKPQFGNMYKNCTVTMGPVFDPITGTYKIAEHSFMEGIDNTLLPLFANIQIDASYNRAVATQDGGAKTKQIFAAMQSVSLNPNRKSDCGSTMYLTKKIDKKNVSSIYLRYILDPETNELVRIDADNISKYDGKYVKMRSPLFCCGEKYCNVCAGDYFYNLGLVNIGNATTRLSTKIMNSNLKAMHNISVKADLISPFKYMKVVK